MARKPLSDEQKAAMKAGREAKKAAAAANPKGASTVISLKPTKAGSIPVASIRIPKNTPIAGIQGVVDNQVQQLLAMGKTATTAAGKLRLF